MFCTSVPLPLYAFFIKFLLNFYSLTINIYLYIHCDLIVSMSDQIPLNEKDKRNNYLRFLGMASTVGINFVATTLVGFAVGHWIIDAYFGTGPWFAIIFMLLGIASGFKYLFKLAKKAGRFDQEDDNEKNNSAGE